MVVCLRTKWLLVEITLLSLKLRIWYLLRATSCLTFRQSIECGFTLKLVRDMTITYSQMHRTDKYSQHSSIIRLVWLNSWVFVHELSGCGFESGCCHLYWTCFCFSSSEKVLLLSRWYWRFFFFFRKILISWAFLHLFCFSSTGGFGYLSRTSFHSYLPFLWTEKSFI